jgi:RES domain-containing protein
MTDRPRPPLAFHSGELWCHVPAGAPFDPGVLARPDDPDDRWSTPGTETAYFAGDPLIAVAEFARHGSADASDARDLVRVTVTGLSVVDLRDAADRAIVGLGTYADALLDRASTRAAAARLRSAPGCQGIVVPSAAFLDAPDRFNLIVFIEQLDRPLAELLSDPRVIGTLSLEPSAPQPAGVARGAAVGAG